MMETNKTDLIQTETSYQESGSIIDLERPKPSEGGCLLRMFWIMYGNGLLACCGMLIIRNGKQLSTVDIVYWAVVAILALARYWDITYFHGTDAFGQNKATIRTWKRYVVLLAIVSLIAWILFHTAAIYL